jgi:hypothetical protein
MKKLAALLLLACLFQKTTAQNDTVPFTSTEEQTKFDKVNSRRIRDLTFAYQTQNYSPRSYACPPYFDLGSPKKWYILSADIIPEFIIGSEKIPLTVHLVTRYMVRILHDDEAAGDSSFAVRTPSFMPGAILYIPVHYVNNESANISYLGISIFHHSNGQDGKEFNHDGSFNLYDGNFSTNYIEPSFHFRRRKYLMKSVSAKQQDPNRNYKDFYGSAGLELHFSTADSLQSSYGNQRINLQLGYISVINYWDEYHGHRLSNYYYGENYRFVFNATFIAGKRDRGLSGLDKRINADINYYRHIKGSPNASLFASTGYYGSDPYNIYYANSYFFIRAGIALGFFIAPNLK